VVGRGGKGNVAGASGREKRMPKSAGDLDAELDAFMKAPPPASGALAESTHAPKAGEVSGADRAEGKGTEARTAD
jgi:hypothetical protein